MPRERSYSTLKGSFQLKYEPTAIKVNETYASSMIISKPASQPQRAKLRAHAALSFVPFMRISLGVKAL